MSQIANRKVAIAVDLSDESAYAVKWAVSNYLRPDDSVILLHVQPTIVLYGADWGAMEQFMDTNDEESKERLQRSFDALTSNKASDLAKPIIDAKIPLKVHIVKDHDMKERICLEVERLGVDVVIMGSRGLGATQNTDKARLGSVSDYCVHHCDCPVVVVRYPDEEQEADGSTEIPKEKSEGNDVNQVQDDTLSDRCMEEVGGVLSFFHDEGPRRCLEETKYLEVSHQRLVIYKVSQSSTSATTCVWPQFRLHSAGVHHLPSLTSAIIDFKVKSHLNCPSCSFSMI